MKIPILIVSENKYNIADIRTRLREMGAIIGDTDISVETEHLPLKLAGTYYDTSGFRVVMVDVSIPGGIAFAKEVRRHNNEIVIMIIADLRIPPMDYMNSAIRAESLLIKPWDEGVLRRVIKDVLELCFQKVEEPSDGNTFLLENSDGKTLIPYKEIFYFEARNKRIYVRTKNQEYASYGTLEKMKELLPRDFEQCHRSYIINKRNISSVSFSKNTIYMHNRIMVPLSRTYKSEFRELIDEVRHK